MASTSTNEAAFVAAFVTPDKRSRYLQFLPDPKRRAKLLDRWNHFFDFIPDSAAQTPRASAAELAQKLRRLGAGHIGYVIGNTEHAGRELPIEGAIEGALASGWGAVVSCVPGQSALYLQEFPPGNVFILESRKSRRLE